MLFQTFKFQCFAFCVFFFLNNNPNDDVVVRTKKFEMDTHTPKRCRIHYSRSESLLCLYRIGSVRLYFGVCFASPTSSPHRHRAPFAFRSPASAPSVGASGGAGWSAPVGLVVSGYCLHTPTSKGSRNVSRADEKSRETIGDKD